MPSYLDVVFQGSLVPRCAIGMPPVFLWFFVVSCSLPIAHTASRSPQLLQQRIFQCISAISIVEINHVFGAWAARRASNGNGSLTLPHTTAENLLPRSALSTPGTAWALPPLLGDLNFKRRRCTLPWLLALSVRISVKIDSESSDDLHVGMNHKTTLRELHWWPRLQSVSPNSLAEQ